MPRATLICLLCCCACATSPKPGDKARADGVLSVFVSPYGVVNGGSHCIQEDEANGPPMFNAEELAVGLRDVLVASGIAATTVETQGILRVQPKLDISACDYSWGIFGVLTATVYDGANAIERLELKRTFRRDTKPRTIPAWFKARTLSHARATYDQSVPVEGDQSLDVAFAEAFSSLTSLAAYRQPVTPIETVALQPKQQTSTSLNTASSMLVMPLRDGAGIGKATCASLTSYLLSRLDEVHGLRTVGTADVEAALGADKQRQALGCDQLSCAAEIGGALGVDLVMYGDLGALGDSYALNVSVVRARDSAVLARSSVLTKKNENAVVERIEPLVKELVTRMNRGGQ